MIDLMAAREQVIEKYPELVINSVGKIEKGWIFSFKSRDEKKLRISPVFVAENDGRIETFFPIEHQAELRNYKKVL